MENYIKIKGKKIALTEQQIKEIEGGFFKSQITLSAIPVGETFKIGEHEFIVLEHAKETTAVIHKDILQNSIFGSNNNFDESKVDELCNEFAAEICNAVGVMNVVAYTVDLISNDGLKDYGKVKRKACLMTAELYRRYVDILDQYKLKTWWWLATPWSTKRHQSDSFVLCVSPAGYVGNGGYSSGDSGVRPFCILKSNIFVSR